MDAPNTRSRTMIKIEVHEAKWETVISYKANGTLLKQESYPAFNEAYKSLLNLVEPFDYFGIEYELEMRRLDAKD